MTIQIEPPLVSAIIIFFNSESFIQEAIESILCQTMKRYELLLVDDGSTDRSTDIALRYRNKYPDKIRYLEHRDHQNLGMSASRNLGISSALGKYVAFVDADDIWLSRRLQRHLEVFETFPAAVMVCSPTLYWYTWRPPGGDWPARSDWIGRLPLPSDTLVPTTISLCQFLRTGAMPCVCGLTMRREEIIRNGGFEESFRSIYEDQVFVSKMCLGGSIVVLDEVLDCYRQHPQSFCYQAGVIGLETIDLEPGRAKFLQWLRQYLTKLNHSDQKLWEELHSQLWLYEHPRIAQAMRLKRRVVRRAGPVIRNLLPKELYQWLKLQDQRYFSGKRSR